MSNCLIFFVSPSIFLQVLCLKTWRNYRRCLAVSMPMNRHCTLASICRTMTLPCRKRSVVRSVVSNRYWEVLGAPMHASGGCVGCVSMPLPARMPSEKDMGVNPLSLVEHRHPDIRNIFWHRSTWNPPSLIISLVIWRRGPRNIES